MDKKSLMKKIEAAFKNVVETLAEPAVTRLVRDGCWEPYLNALLCDALNEKMPGNSTRNNNLLARYEYTKHTNTGLKAVSKERNSKSSTERNISRIDISILDIEKGNEEVEVALLEGKVVARHGFKKPSGGSNMLDRYSKDIAKLKNILDHYEGDSPLCCLYFWSIDLKNIKSLKRIMKNETNRNQANPYMWNYGSKIDGYLQNPDDYSSPLEIVKKLFDEIQSENGRLYRPTENKKDKDDRQNILLGDEYKVEIKDNIKSGRVELSKPYYGFDSDSENPEVIISVIPVFFYKIKKV